MFKSVLVGVDGSDNARDAIALARRLVDPNGTLTLVNVYSGQLRPTHAISPGVVAEEREAADRLLVQERDAAGLSAELVSVVALSPGRGLHEQAEDQRADLLVVGSCRHSAFGRAMLGDDTRSALNGARCAVAIAARGYAEHPAALARIGIGYNGSPESKTALATARELAASTGATLKALEVVVIPTYAFVGVVPPLAGEGVDMLLQEATAGLSELTGVEGRAVYGLTGEELASFGDEVDLLVVGSRSYGPVLRMVLGSTSDYLERHARCSLLVLPRGEEHLAEEADARADAGASSAEQV